MAVPMGTMSVDDVVVERDADTMEEGPLTWLVKEIRVVAVAVEAMTGLRTMEGVLASDMVKASKFRLIVARPYAREDAALRSMGRRGHMLGSPLVLMSWRAGQR